MENSKILDSTIEDSTELINKFLWRKWLLLLFSPLIVYLIGKYVVLNDEKTALIVAIAFLIGDILGMIIDGFVSMYIYDYSTDKLNSTVYLVNVFGRKKSMNFTSTEIKKIEFKKKKFRIFDRYLLLLTDSGEKLYFINKRIGQDFFQRFKK